MYITFYIEKNLYTKTKKCSVKFFIFLFSSNMKSSHYSFFLLCRGELGLAGLGDLSCTKKRIKNQVYFR